MSVEELNDVVGAVGVRLDGKKLEERLKEDLVFTVPDGGAETLVYGPDYFLRLKQQNPALDAERRYHVHFGAGRLGLGLVVPAIAASGVPFAVVQRPKPRWQEIFLSDGESRVDVAVNDESDLAGVLGKATSFSCSLGAAMNKVMRSTPRRPELMSEADVVSRQNKARRAAETARRRRRYVPDYVLGDGAGGVVLRENDHAAVAALKRSLRTRVRVVDCMVDRVCTGRRIGPAGVEIDAEPWSGSIVVLEPGFTNRMVPFGRDIVSLPVSLTHADYLSERKFSLVNGMHTVLAFLTLHRLYGPSASGREYVLLKYTQMRRCDQRAVEAARSARVAALLDKFGADQIARWEGVDTREAAWDALLRFSDEVLVDRFSAIDDLVSRVLGGGVANRYQTRLLPTARWMRRRDDLGAADDLGAFFLHAAERDLLNAERRLDDDENPVGCDPFVDAECGEDDELEPPCETPLEAEAFVRGACAAAVADSKRFCNKELEITHKSLIKEQRRAGGKKFSPTVQTAIAEDKARAVAVARERRKARGGRQRDVADP
ncbi:hypothetical protein JL720_7626 [Aureococcus anophagefferens]|nr:hypothetical protein JL720_7626 [Aureococcus anophagefferens]